MSLGIRKVTVLALVVGIFLLANLWFLVNWLQDQGVVDVAQYVRAEYLTGTAITVIIALLILFVRPNGERSTIVRRCSVCEHVMLGMGRYCSACGSKA